MYLIKIPIVMMGRSSLRMLVWGVSYAFHFREPADGASRQRKLKKYTPELQAER